MRPAAFGSTTRYRIATGSFLPPTSWLDDSILPFSLIASCSSEPQLRVSSAICKPPRSRAACPA